jgi:Raf kinase inhibitor-like YbhB/YbcL family protein
VLRTLALGLLLTSVACGSGGGGSVEKSSSTTSSTTPAQTPAGIELTSSAFAPGGNIPGQFTCDGANQSPPLTWRGVTPEVGSIAVRLQDIDTPQKFVHWIVYDINPSTTSLAAGQVPAGAKQAMNSFGKIGYGGPCPPAGQRHRYVFTILALATQLSVSESVSPTDLWATLERSAVIAKGELTGTYQRPSS